jgi:hypothetical protein
LQSYIYSAILCVMGLFHQDSQLVIMCHNFDRWYIMDARLGSTLAALQVKYYRNACTKYSWRRITYISAKKRKTRSHYPQSRLMNLFTIN